MKVWVLAMVRAPAVEDLDRWAQFQEAFPPGWVHRDCNEERVGCRARMLRVRAVAASRDDAAAQVVPVIRELAAGHFGAGVEVDWIAQPAGPRFFLTREQPWRSAAEAGGEGQVGVRRAPSTITARIPASPGSP